MKHRRKHKNLVIFFCFPGLKKKLAAAAKVKGCERIALWSHSVVMHMYHAVVVAAGDGELAVAVWLSMLNHVQDIHDGHSELYRTCQHGQLQPRKWIYPGLTLFRFHFMTCPLTIPLCT